MIPNRVDQLFLAHVRPAFDPDALCLVVKFLLRPILEVGAAMIERAACPGVGDSRRLLLRRAVVAQRLVRFVVFYLRSMILRHRPSPVIGRSEEHTSELQSLMRISYAVFCLKKKKKQNITTYTINYTYYTTH